MLPYMVYLCPNLGAQVIAQFFRFLRWHLLIHQRIVDGWIVAGHYQVAAPRPQSLEEWTIHFILKFKLRVKKNNKKNKRKNGKIVNQRLE